MISNLVWLAMSYVGVPYRWGGQDYLTGLDCSGFVQVVLNDAGVYSLTTDRTSQDLYFYYKDKGHSSKIESGTLLFFGKSNKNIYHVAIAINDELMINAAGGDSTCTTKERALELDARVKVQRINYRNDLVASINLEV